MLVKENLQKIQNEIQEICQYTGRDNDVTIIAVTKYVKDTRVIEGVQAGIKNFAENRAENYKVRKENFPGNVWHLIGTLQKRKVKDVIDEVDYFHALDRFSLAEEINKRATKVVDCFVQVNVSGEETKHGVAPEDVEQFISELEQFDKIRVVGLMTMAPYTDDKSLIRECFSKLRTIRDSIKVKNLSYAPCEFLSMGMSNDYKIAVEEGATHIRVGSSLVGEH